MSLHDASRGAGLEISLRGLLGTILALLHTRLELLGTELEEEKLRLMGVLTYAVAAFFFLGCGIVLLTIFLTLLLWDVNRLLAAGIATAVFLCFGIVAAIHAYRLSYRTSNLFSASLAELEQDRVAVQGSAGNAAND